MGNPESVAASVADSVDHALDPRVITLQRIHGAIFTALLAIGSLVAVVISVLAEDDEPAWPKVVLWLTVVPLLAAFFYRWPARAYRHTSYRVDDQGIEIRRGVFWRVVINVPRSRVQHIDVSQGPVERKYGLGTLVLYTAGTDHAKVELEGLEHGRALAIREHLLRPTTQTTRGGDPGPEGSSDAV